MKKEEMYSLFDNGEKHSLFIERACASLGPKSLKACSVLGDYFREPFKGINSEVLQVPLTSDTYDGYFCKYSYNDLICLLHEMKKSIVNKGVNFKFGKARSEKEISLLLKNGMKELQL